MLFDIEPIDAAIDCWYLTGPTASGKSRVGIELAQRLDAEIISLDSMAVYQDMDIGTAKPTETDRKIVPHHLIDILKPTEECSVAEYVRLAHEKIDEIRQRGKEVLFVGGSSLYLKSLLRGIYQGPPADWKFRQEVEAEVERVGVAALHERLKQVDPLAAAKLHPNDKRRIIRALEVYRLTGTPLSHRQIQFEEGRPAEQCRVFVLTWRREMLHRRINDRVERMFSNGLVEEVRDLLNHYGQLSRTASQAVGYCEVIEHLEGKRSLNDTIEAVKTRTRQFARRQQTWFRSLSECRFIELAIDSQAADVANFIECIGKAASES
jgi:tRNA dimethylallyltransferase